MPPETMLPVELEGGGRKMDHIKHVEEQSNPTMTGRNSSEIDIKTEVVLSVFTVPDRRRKSLVVSPGQAIGAVANSHVEPAGIFAFEFSFGQPTVDAETEPPGMAVVVLEDFGDIIAE